MGSMTDTPFPSSEEPAAVPPEELGHSYEAFMEGSTWEVDTGNAPPEPSPPSPDQPAPPAPPPLVRIVEALLFVGGPPLTPVRAGETIRGLTSTQFLQAIDT